MNQSKKPVKKEIVVKLEIKQLTNNTQACPICDQPIGIMPGSRDAICHNCGFKDPCCE